MRIPFALQAYRHRSLPVSAQRIINWFAETEPRDAKSPVVLTPTPGLSLFATVGVGPWRGGRVMGAYAYIVSGLEVYRVDVTGAGTLLGTISNGGAVSMADNGTQMAIVVPETTQAWVATSATLVQITDVDFPGATMVTYLNGYHVFSQPNSTRFFWSAILNATAYNALDYASAESSPDGLVAVERAGDFLWMFGERSIEIWGGSTQGETPFTEVNGGLIDRGIGARFSIAVVDSKPYWLGENRVIYRGEGSTAVRISTHAIEQSIGGYNIVSDARAWIIEQEGHQFLVMTFPDAGDTWVYDITTSSWHERESEPSRYGGIWRAIGGMTFGGAVIAGDSVAGTVYVVDPTLSDENGDPIIRVATGSPMINEGKMLFFRRLEADMETGIGTVSGQGSAPVCWLLISDDGARTFGYRKEASLGALGDYKARVRWHRLGASRNRVFRIQMSDPVRTTLIAANFDAETGAH